MCEIFVNKFYIFFYRYLYDSFIYFWGNIEYILDECSNFREDIKYSYILSIKTPKYTAFCKKVVVFLIFYPDHYSKNFFFQEFASNFGDGGMKINLEKVFQVFELQ